MNCRKLFVYSWHLDYESKKTTNIRAYGMTKKGKVICLRVDDFTPYVYIELPDVPMDNSSVAALIGNYLEHNMYRGSRPLLKRLVYKYKLYGARFDRKGQRKKYPYLRCTFKCSNDINTLYFLLKNKVRIPNIGLVELRVHENKASPLLQFICCTGLKQVGWLKYVGKEVPEDDTVTRAHKEYYVKWTELTDISCEDVLIPKIMAFDIEVNSGDPTRFPVAEEPTDVVFQIGCIVVAGNTTTKYLLSLGNPSQSVTGDDIVIQTYGCEADLIAGFVDLVRDTNVNIVAGYNSLGFDIKYLIGRAKFRYCVDNLQLAGFYNGKAEMIDKKWESSAYADQHFIYMDWEGIVQVDILPIVKRSVSLNNYKLKTVSTHFLGETKDPLSVKGIFKCYKLGMKGNDKAMGIVGKYCVQDSFLVIRLMNHLQTWFELVEMANICNIQMFTLFTKGQQIRVYSQVYKYCLSKGYVVENSYDTGDSNLHYVGATVFEAVAGCYENVIPFDFASLYPTTIIAYNIDMSTLVDEDSNIPDSKCHVMEWHDHVGCMHDETVIAKQNVTSYIDSEKDKIKSLMTKRDRVSNKLQKKEYQEEINKLRLDLKPYISKRAELAKKKPKYPMCAKRNFKFVKDNKGVIPSILEDLLTARSAAKKSMKEYYKRIKDAEENGEDANDLKNMYSILDKRQLALKISANSAYGAMGADPKKSYLPFMPGAMCTTYMGRMNIGRVAKHITEDYGGVLVYGDTDSNYITFPHIKTVEEAWEYAIHVAAEISKLFPSPIKLEFEECIYVLFFLLGKKMYMYKTYKDGVISEEIGKKGVLLARRDNCEFIRDIYRDCIKMIFERRDNDYILDHIVKRVNELCSSSLPLSKFVITKSVKSAGDFTNNANLEFRHDDYVVVNNGKHILLDSNGAHKMVIGVEEGDKLQIGNYKTPILPDDQKISESKMKSKGCDSIGEYYKRSLPAQVQLAIKMSKRGYMVSNGSRIEYIVSDIGKPTAKQFELIENIEYALKNSTIIRPNLLDYLRQATNPIDNLLNAACNTDKLRVQDFLKNQYTIRKNRLKVMEDIKSLGRPLLKIYKDN